jgi:hypothetical protein
MKGLLFLSLATQAGIAWAAAGQISGALDPQPSALGPCSTYAQWLQFAPKADARPWWKRLRFSLFGEIGLDKAKLRADQEKAELTGAYRDNDKPEATWNSAAGGIKVEVEL